MIRSNAELSGAKQAMKMVRSRVHQRCRCPRESCWTTMRSSRRPARDSASGIVDGCGPKSPGSHRAVWGLISRPPVSPAGFPPVSRLPAGFFPFVRLPLVSLRPAFSGSFVPFGRCPVPVPPRFPSGFPFPWAIFTLALPRAGSAGVGPRQQGPRSPALPRPPRLDRAIRPHCQMGSGWARRDAATESPVTSGRQAQDIAAPEPPISVRRRARLATGPCVFSGHAPLKDIAPSGTVSLCARVLRASAPSGRRMTETGS